MRRRITWRSAAAISMLGLAPGIGAAFAAPAGASTNACLAAQGTTCGTFTESPAGETPRSGDNGGLAWDVKNQSTAYNTPLIEYPNYSPGQDPGTDLTKVEHIGPLPGSPSARSVRWYSIVYTPSGDWTSMCVSNPDLPGMGGTNLVLRSCNQQKWQAFLAAAPSDTRLPGSAKAAEANTDATPHYLPATPTRSLPIENENSREAIALCSVANGRFVQVAEYHMMSAAAPAPGPGPGRQPRTLSATGRRGETATPSNTWFWTNAAGTTP